MDHVLESLCGSEQGPNDVMMWTLLHCSIIDASVVDKPWNGCQGITPSNSKVGLPALEAETHVEREA